MRPLLIGLLAAAGITLIYLTLDAILYNEDLTEFEGFVQVNFNNATNDLQSCGAGGVLGNEKMNQLISDVLNEEDFLKMQEDNFAKYADILAMEFKVIDVVSDDLDGLIESEGAAGGDIGPEDIEVTTITPSADDAERNGGRRAQREIGRDHEHEGEGEEQHEGEEQRALFRRSCRVRSVWRGRVSCQFCRKKKPLFRGGRRATRRRLRDLVEESSNSDEGTNQSFDELVRVKFEEKLLAGCGAEKDNLEILFFQNETIIVE